MDSLKLKITEYMPSGREGFLGPESEIVRLAKEPQAWKEVSEQNFIQIITRPTNILVQNPVVQRNFLHYRASSLIAIGSFD